MTREPPVGVVHPTPRGNSVSDEMTRAEPARRDPIRVALVDDYEVVLRGVAHMFDRYPQIAVVEIDVDGGPFTTDVDIALYDTFAQAEADLADIEALVANPHARRVVVYTWRSPEGR